MAQILERPFQNKRLRAFSALSLPFIKLVNPFHSHRLPRAAKQVNVRSA